MAVDSDAIRRDNSHQLGRSEGRLGDNKIAALAQHGVNKRATAIDRAIEVSDN